ncbi:MAG: lipopolysaccharide biosynthesis protein [Coprococcus phoceensis]
MNSKKVFSGFLWRFAERCGAQSVAFIVSIVLARLLDPDTYGTIALITVFITILNVFVDSGMGNALIQKKTADELDFSTVFYFNIFSCSILYLVIFITAPLIAEFYNRQELIPLVRVLSLTVVISGVKNIQQAYVSCHMLFKKFFFSTLAGTIGAAIIGIAMAYLGFGVWALVAQQLFNTLVDTVVLWSTVEWKPIKKFSFERLKQLFDFGWKLLVSSLINTLYSNIRSLIIGKKYSASDLAYYNQGNKFPNVIITNVNNSIDSVLLPAMASEQDNTERVKSMTRRSIKMSTYIIAPLMMGLVFVATPLVRLVLTEKWLPCVPYLRIFCITYIFYPMHTANLNAIKALGRSDLFLKLEIAKKILGMFLLLVSMWFGVMAMAYSLLIADVVSQVINSWPNRTLLQYSYNEQMRDIAPNIFLAVVMGLVISIVPIFAKSDIFILFLQLLIGGVVYVEGSLVFKLDSFSYLLEIVKYYIKR